MSSMWCMESVVIKANRQLSVWKKKDDDLDPKADERWLAGTIA